MTYEVKKFKNGKLKLFIDKNSIYINKDGTIDEEYYHNEMFMNDLSIDFIENEWYIVDTNKWLVYRMGSYLMQNPIKEILDTLQESGKIYFNPCTQKESNEIMNAAYPPEED
jgi:hypothetical protein